VTINNPQMQDNPPPAQPTYQTVPVRIPRNTPYVTYGLLGITILMFLLQLGTKSLLGYDLPAALGVKDNSLIAQGQFWRLITPLFLHSTSMLLHVAFNMYALFAFGPSLERYYGHAGFILLYFLAGFTGNVLSFMFSAAPSLGASTAIFGLVGAEAVFLYRNRKLLGSRAQGALMNLLVIVVLNLFLGLSSGFVDNWGHIGGLVGGVLFAWFGGPLMKVDGVYPDYQVVNSRSPRETYLVGAALFVLFAGLAGVTIIFRG
jgi:rhomboid protease GluP